MTKKFVKPASGSEAPRRIRADAHRNIESLLRAALTVFAKSGVDAPVREIADEAGVGIATLYRHFPQRSDLVAAVFRHEMDACVEAAAQLAAEFNSGEALAQWMQRYARFIGTKRRLAAALHSGSPAFEGLADYFDIRLRPALRMLLAAAVAAGEARSDVDGDDILHAVAQLCMSSKGDGPDKAASMVALLVDGLRYGAKKP